MDHPPMISAIDRYAGYRPEIDGLRAIAVGGVVLYHFDLPGLTGGFTGVDVFFVLSGYLIGAILWREYMATGRVDLFRFFLRRFRRLAPAWAVVAMTVFIAGYAILLPHDLRELGKSLIAAVLFIANIQFWRQAGYFDSGTVEKPLLHMWSLSLEEQFYIILPLILLICTRRPRLALAVLGGGAALSLALSIGMTTRDQAAAFFLFPFRAWELLSGVLLAIWTQTHPEPRQGWIGSVVGLVLMVTGMLVIQPGAGFPGVWALIPILGTLLLIHHGRCPNSVNRLLSWGPMRWLGLISYSLYLWHWPIRTLSDFVLGPGRGLAGNVGLIALSVALAYGTWRWVERPTRNVVSLPTGPLMTGIAASSGLLLALGAWPYLREGLPERWPDAVLTHADASQDFIQDWSRCHTPDTGPFEGIDVCAIGPEGTPQMLAWGDSHLRAVKEGLDRAAHEAGTPALLIWRAGCPPLFGIEKRELAATRAQDIACGQANAQIEAALRAHPYPDVLLVGRWSYYATGIGIGADAHNRIDVSPNWPAAVEDTLQALTEMGSRVHVLRQAPEIPDYGSLLVARALARNETVPQARMQVPLERALARETVGLAPFVSEPSRISLIDPWPMFCDSNVCSALQNGRTIYFDNNHVTNQAALQMRHFFSPMLTSQNVF